MAYTPHPTTHPSQRSRCPPPRACCCSGTGPGWFSRNSVSQYKTRCFSNLPTYLRFCLVPAQSRLPVSLPWTRLMSNRTRKMWEQPPVGSPRLQERPYNPFSTHNVPCFVAGESVFLASARHSPYAVCYPQDKVLRWDEAFRNQTLANFPVLVMPLSLNPHPCPASCDLAALKFL